MREGLSDYPRHSGATMSYPSFAKLPLKSMSYLDPQKYLMNYFQTCCMRGAKGSTSSSMPLSCSSYFGT